MPQVSWKGLLSLFINEDIETERLSDSDEVMFSLGVSELGLKPVISPLHKVHLK